MSPDGSLALARSDATEGSSAKSAIVPGKIATHRDAGRRRNSLYPSCRSLYDRPGVKKTLVGRFPDI
jgi:hypothetical protein